MTLPIDYSAATGALTLVAPQVPVSGDVVTVRGYNAAAATPALPYNIPTQYSTNDGSLSGTLNGVNAVFGIVTGALVTQIILFWNGDMMTEGIDYSWSCVQNSSAGPWISQITMMAGQFPNAGDVLTAEVFSA
jgi:hypothetical protein